VQFPKPVTSLESQFSRTIQGRTIEQTSALRRSHDMVGFAGFSEAMEWMVGRANCRKPNSDVNATVAN
jgi:hypothetical protein